MKHLCTIVCSLVIGCAASHSATVYFTTVEGSLAGVEVAEATEAVSALQSLARGSFAGPEGQPLSSAVPVGTRVVSLEVNEEVTTIEFSGEILTPEMDELRLATLFEQVRLTLEQFGMGGSLRLQSEGRLLSDYLARKPVIEPRPKVQLAPSLLAAGALAGKTISLSPGHGKVWTGSYYAFERPVYCAPLNCEDDHNLENMAYLNQYLTQDGAGTEVYRCLNKSFGTHTPSGEPWWRISAGYWLKQLGYPCSVYASSTGDCNLGTGGTESSDSLRSRGLASDYDGTDIYVSLHSNGSSGYCVGTGCPNGTCTYYDTSTEHATWGTISRTLATKVNAAIVSAIRTRYTAVAGNTDPTWRDRGALDANGGFAETRIPNRAAILIELAFHDTCDRDGLYLRDNFFRTTAMWATYKGICDYFGVAPGWDYYSYEIVSDDIPPVLMPGATATVHITLRNRGVLWDDIRQFRLGAVGDTDPFTTSTRYNVGTEIGPGQTKTFTLTLRAPVSPGTYTTDWRMVREGVTWFGPALTRNILVSTNGDTVAPTVPANVVATATAFNQVDLRWNASTDNVGVSSYRIYRNSLLLGTSLTTNYTDLNCASMTTYSYQVAATDASNNESARSAAAGVTTPPQLEFIIDNLQGTITSGTWSTGTASADKYLTDYNFKDTATSDTATFRWTPRIEQPGFYNVFVWYPEGANRCTNSAYRIVYAGGSSVVPVNQTTGGGGWRSLGTAKPFIRGTTGWVQLGNGTVQTGKVVLADGVRLTYASALPALPLLEQNLSGNSLTLTWANPYCVLQQASSLTGAPSDWVDVPAASSPFAVNTTASPARYYRLRY